MHSFQDVGFDMMDFNPYSKIGSDWMLVTAGDENKANTMTASWGYTGVMWGENVMNVVIRQSRYTKEFIDKTGKFSVAFLDDKYKTIMRYLGSVSGRNENKLKTAGIDLDFCKGVPYPDQANTVFICEVMSATVIKKEDILVPELYDKWYSDDDLHTQYIAKITDILAR